MPFVITTIDFNYEDAAGSAGGGRMGPGGRGKAGSLRPEG